MWPIPVDVPIYQDFLLPGVKNNPGLAMTPKGITVHATANTQSGAGAKSHARYIKGPDCQARGASWHGTIDDHEIWLHLPYDRVGWHAGDGYNGPGNRTTIGLEMCMNRDGNLNRTEANTIWLIAKLLLDTPTIDAVIPGSVWQHWHWNKANCPSTLRSRANGWADFTEAISQQLLKQTSGGDVTDPDLRRRIKLLEDTVKQLRTDLDGAIKAMRNAGSLLAG